MAAVDEKILAGSARQHPVQLTVDEASAMASWVVHLTDSIEDGVAFGDGAPGRPQRSRRPSS